jgi:hypothetical protein
MPPVPITFPSTSHADHHVARGSIEPTARPAGVRRDDAAHGGAVGKRRIERHHLPVGRQQLGQLAPRHAGLHAHGQIARLILQHATQPGHGDSVVAFGRAAHGALAAGAFEHDRPLMHGRTAQLIRQLVGRPGGSNYAHTMALRM